MDAIIDRLPLEYGPDKTRGEWFVVRRRPIRDAALDHDEEPEYLHADGVWRTSTYAGGHSIETDKPTGYYATRDDAKAALVKACGEIDK